MNRKFRYYALIWAILFAVFNIICFATPSEAAGMYKFGGAFWAGYIFITLAFIGQLICAYIALKTDDLTKLFYNIPIIRVSYTGLILTLIFGALCMAIPDLPNWGGGVICLLILTFTAIAVVKAKAASDVVGKIGSRVTANTLFIKSLTADAENLISRAATPEAKAACKKVCEAVRYSDPMSNDALTEIESGLSEDFGILSDAVKANDTDAIRKAAEDFLNTLAVRNRKCKLLK